MPELRLVQGNVPRKISAMNYKKPKLKLIASRSTERPQKEKENAASNER